MTMRIDSQITLEEALKVLFKIELEGKDTIRIGMNRNRIQVRSVDDLEHITGVGFKAKSSKDHKFFMYSSIAYLEKTYWSMF